MKVTNVAEMNAMDTLAIEEFGMPAVLLMENAGQAVYFTILNEFGVKHQRFLIVCGPGNNGGDGLVVARKLHSTGGSVQVFILGDPRHFTGPVKTNADIAARMGIEIQSIASVDTFKAALTHCDAVVDAILGTGITRDIRGRYREVIEAINHSNKTVFSVDIPSGVDGDTGKVMGTAIRADHTVTFGLPKIGNLLPPGANLGGKLRVSHISFPPSLTGADSLKVEINEPTPTLAEIQVADKRAPEKTLFIVGTTHNERTTHPMIQSFIQTKGKGTLILAAPPRLAPSPMVPGKILTFFPQEETPTGSIALKNKAALLELVHQADQVVLSMDPSTDSGTQQLCRELITEIDRPLVINGPTTATACEHQGLAQGREAETVRRIEKRSMKEVANHVFREIRDDRVRGLQRLCRKCDAIFVLEGERPLIGYPDERVFININTDSVMARENAEALLPGVLTALITWGLPLRDAVRQSVGLRGLSMDLAVKDLGRETDTTKTILNCLPTALKKAKAALAEPSEGDSTKIQVI